VVTCANAAIAGLLVLLVVGALIGIGPIERRSAQSKARSV